MNINIQRHLIHMTSGQGYAEAKDLGVAHISLFFEPNEEILNTPEFEIVIDAIGKLIDKAKQMGAK